MPSDITLLLCEITFFFSLFLCFGTLYCLYNKSVWEINRGKGRFVTVILPRCYGSFHDEESLEQIVLFYVVEDQFSVHSCWNWSTLFSKDAVLSTQSSRMHCFWLLSSWSIWVGCCVSLCFGSDRWFGWWIRICGSNLTLLHMPSMYSDLIYKYRTEIWMEIKIGRYFKF